MFCYLHLWMYPAVQFGKAELEALSPVVLGVSYSTIHPSSAYKRLNQVHHLSSHMSRQGAYTTLIASRCGWVARRCLFRTGDPYKFDYNTCTHMSIVVYLTLYINTCILNDLLYIMDRILFGNIKQWEHEKKLITYQENDPL